jgi:hypothetical protein
VTQIDVHLRRQLIVNKAHFNSKFESKIEPADSSTHISNDGWSELALESSIPIGLQGTDEYRRLR